MDLEHTQIAAGHLVERFRLLFIVVLGETVLTTGRVFANEPFGLVPLLALALGSPGSWPLVVLLDRGEPLGAGAAKTAENSGAVGLWATWALGLIVVVLVAIAVADEMAIVRRGDRVHVPLHRAGLRRPGLVPARPPPLGVAADAKAQLT